MKERDRWRAGERERWRDEEIERESWREKDGDNHVVHSTSQIIAAQMSYLYTDYTSFGINETKGEKERNIREKGRRIKIYLQFIGLKKLKKSSMATNFRWILNTDPDVSLTIGSESVETTGLNPDQDFY